MVPYCQTQTEWRRPRLLWMFASVIRNDIRIGLHIITHWPVDWVMFVDFYISITVWILKQSNIAYFCYFSTAIPFTLILTRPNRSVGSTTLFRVHRAFSHTIATTYQAIPFDMQIDLHCISKRTRPHSFLAFLRQWTLHAYTRILRISDPFPAQWAECANKLHCSADMRALASVRVRVCRPDIRHGGLCVKWSPCINCGMITINPG